MRNRGQRLARFQQLLLVPAVVLGVFAAACGGSAASPSPSPSASPTPGVAGQLNVYAAASLTESFNDAKTTLQRSNPALALTYNFAGSQALVQQIQAGAPADVFASADTRNMQKLVDAGLVDTPQTFVRNKLEIVVPPGNPKHVIGLSDLAHSDLTVVLCDQSVPCGLYGMQALQKAHVAVQPKSLELDVKTVVQKVATGNADAGIVYVTDVKAAGSSVSGVEIPDSQNIIATYPIAVVKRTKNPPAAAFFVSSAASGKVQKALEARGFLPP